MPDVLKSQAFLFSGSHGAAYWNYLWNFKILKTEAFKNTEDATLQSFWFNTSPQDFLDGPAVKNPPLNAGDTVSIPDPGRYHTMRSN